MIFIARIFIRVVFFNALITRLRLENHNGFLLKF